MAFPSRAEAGQLLAERLDAYAGRDDVIVLAIPPGGVPVGYAVARALEAPLDAFVIREISVPGLPDRPLGALATGGARIIDLDVADELGLLPHRIAAYTATEQLELEQAELALRGDRPPPDVEGRTAILVDDGVAAGPRLPTAVHALRQERAARIVVAAPVITRDALQDELAGADEVVSLATSLADTIDPGFYEGEPEPADDEVRALLARARRPAVGRGREGVIELTGEATDHDWIVERARDARVVLLGEASHGTHEFYAQRAAITQRLVEEAGYTVVAVEADWPDAYRVNRYVRGVAGDDAPEDALSDFRRFPVWMWRNTEVADFARRLRAHNATLDDDKAKAGFYGLDLYALHASMDRVVEYLGEIDPEAAERARRRYSCFDHFGPDPQVYAYEAGLAGAEPCTAQAVEQLRELQRMTAEALARGDDPEVDAAFYAEQNARLVVNAEEYYRASFLSGITSWNLRDQHMAETLEVLVHHLGRTTGRQVKAVVWAHNSHVGDARATELGQAGELNVGQLVKARLREEALNVGFTTYAGMVTAASDWGAVAERKRVRRALPGSWEELLHEREEQAFLLDTSVMSGRRLQRAIGVIYRPETERRSHYFHARLADQFDAVIHLDTTSAVEPLETSSEWRAGELPETFPFGV